MYHNTTDEYGEDLKDFQSKAKGQDNILSKWFMANPEKEVTASELWINLFETESTPLTSIRRSLNSLKKMKVIAKLEEKKTGIYGRPENLWSIWIDEDGQLELNL